MDVQAAKQRAERALREEWPNRYADARDVARDVLALAAEVERLGKIPVAVLAGELSLEEGRVALTTSDGGGSSQLCTCKAIDADDFNNPAAHEDFCPLSSVMSGA